MHANRFLTKLFAKWDSSENIRFHNEVLAKKTILLQPYKNVKHFAVYFLLF